MYTLSAALGHNLTCLPCPGPTPPPLPSFLSLAELLSIYSAHKAVHAGWPSSRPSLCLVSFRSVLLSPDIASVEASAIAGDRVTAGDGNNNGLLYGFIFPILIERMTGENDVT